MSFSDEECAELIAAAQSNRRHGGPAARRARRAVSVAGSQKITVAMPNAMRATVESNKSRSSTETSLGARDMYGRSQCSTIQRHPQTIAPLAAPVLDPWRIGVRVNFEDVMNLMAARALRNR